MPPVHLSRREVNALGYELDLHGESCPRRLWMFRLRWNFAMDGGAMVDEPAPACTCLDPAHQDDAS